MKKLIQNRRSAGWNLIEIIVAVAIGASIAAAGVVAYQGEAKKAAVAKAKQFISQVESKKAAIVSDVSSGEITAPSSSDLQSLILADIKVQGDTVTSLSDAAGKMGVSSITLGDLPTVNADGTLSGGSAASVTLKNGGSVTGTTVTNS